MKKINIAFYDTKPYDKESFLLMNKNFGFNIEFFDFHLNEKTAFSSKGFNVICAFVNDILDETVINILKQNNVELIAMRCAGYNNVDLTAADKAGIKIVRVPAYSPNAVAEHAVAILLALTRHIPQAYLRTKTGNFTLTGLTGRNLNGLTAGILGTGKIGQIMAELLSGFGMKIILYDLYPNNFWAEKHNFEYVPLEDLFKKSDVLSLHCPLTQDTKHIINKQSLKLMKHDAVIINTGRGALIDTQALVHALKHQEIGGAALDVYEEESKYFFNDWSANVIRDDILARLLTFPNVIVTSHQAFLTTNALENIADITLNNIKDFSEENELKNRVFI